MPLAPDRFRLAAWILSAISLYLILQLHMLPALLAGLLVYQLVHIVAPFFAARLSNERAKLAAVALLGTVVIGATVTGVMLIVAFFRSDAGSVADLGQRLAEIIERARETLPGWLEAYLPPQDAGLQATVVHWLREHSQDVQLAGRGALRGLAHALLGMIIGAMIALHEACPDTTHPPLAAALLERSCRLGEAFRRIVFAQVRISTINTGLTALYLGVALPLLGIHLPLIKTMIAFTFIAGLLPVLGNLISNTVIVVISLAHSVELGAASLAFLIAIHKLEYFLNAHIIGSRISARAWELLLAMLALEAAFGIPGLVAAPIYYAYLKDELHGAGWI
ncbi:MAG: AI-2E family transporter [Proteobacteria bacterium]|nr:AI-2E family transporter [Pseudomonadota bacterium]HQR04580.1 hypothetical protein [Rhodocyclaceae bacterium]